ncbi:hypothetical protein MMC11_006999 [Xylographa trunciseda]|nr:hypothetical protein [Xylographa trunciseda]
MPPGKNAVSCIRKRQRCAQTVPTTTPQLLPSAKRRKLERQPQDKTPSSFRNTVLRQWLSPREFDSRTGQRAAPLPPDLSGLEKDHSQSLKRFARHGGPSLDDLRPYPDPTAASSPIQPMSSSQLGSRNRAKSRSTSDRSTRTRKSSAYDGGFEQHLIDHCIYPEGYGGARNVQEPDNWEEINAKLVLPRESLSPSRFTREDFLLFKDRNQDALTEGTVMSKAFPMIIGDADIPFQLNLPFGNLADLTDGSITKAQPDFYDGSRPADLNKRIREQLGPYIVPSTTTNAPCLPNFFVEGKGPTGSASVAKRQACYNGGVGARGVLKARSFIDSETALDDRAYTITSTYHGGTGTLKLYTTHPAPSKNPEYSTEYRMTQLRGWDMTDHPDTFRQGASAIRNARDWAKEQRDALILAANGIAPGTRSTRGGSPVHSMLSSSTTRIAQPESDTSTDELAVNPLPDARSARNTPVGIRSSSTRRSKKRAARASKASGGLIHSS